MSQKSTFRYHFDPIREGLADAEQLVLEQNDISTGS
jgi:hypothetical protein